MLVNFVGFATYFDGMSLVCMVRFWREPKEITLRFRVAELLDGGSALAGGVKVGDLVRGMTFVTMGMSYPTWQVALGGIGRPTMQKQLMPTRGQTFETVMAAIGSNSREDGNKGNGQIVLLLERST